MKNKKQALIELLDGIIGCGYELHDRIKVVSNSEIADHLLAHGVTIAAEARLLEEWHEDIGDVLWWKFPIEEPPYVGSPLDCAWTGYHTHWTPIICPEPPKENK